MTLLSYYSHNYQTRCQVGVENLIIVFNRLITLLNLSTGCLHLTLVLKQNHTLFCILVHIIRNTESISDAAVVILKIILKHISGGQRVSFIG